MKQVDSDMFRRIVEYIKEANNYCGGGSVRHSVIDEEIYYIYRNGEKITAARTFDVFSERNALPEYYNASAEYYVDTDVYNKYRATNGYTV